MRTAIKTTEVFTFEELSQSARDNAINNLSDINVDHEWWDCTYEDAERVGIKITSFDLDRNRECSAIINDCLETANSIMTEHGEVCDAYKLAEQFITDRDKLVDEAPRDEDGEFEDEYELDNKLDELETEFKRALCEEYSIILQKEYNYLTSSEAIIETIEANEYEFDADGKLY